MQDVASEKSSRKRPKAMCPFDSSLFDTVQNQITIDQWLPNAFEFSYSQFFFFFFYDFVPFAFLCPLFFYFLFSPFFNKQNTFIKTERFQMQHDKISEIVGHCLGNFFAGLIFLGFFFFFKKKKKNSLFGFALFRTLLNFFFYLFVCLKKKNSIVVSVIRITPKYGPQSSFFSLAIHKRSKHKRAKEGLRTSTVSRSQPLFTYTLTGNGGGGKKNDRHKVLVE
ncbi:hypothetical protein RFI_26855 [Reticulomyxa filosa]|uniref:Transmembrane protein n=1 Tax=Reticulomyxa filosa TaxID=46433 RepID=X6MAM6_RETFI|nr:hypothetical protein RFI_26855 [Reticulomyxa filosa]|eukprot:ETO10522.1 hypothetical protein RFI_26855 [Reticulomyxa filosa]